ncbi:nitroreductase family deazaflavin-dependent oxidoreductase [Hoyosella altamirensis]|uniref:Deazaflavin-dependent oxidoreductase (Nitroreductase family) n=1 Tax=Hoyosella altamirensis TaxID=616997 RepID=A0A839RI59_9ACTN|nr:nitroreductase family deazaflavin-dependent oxidoreductase [Hoyosella altamirensis]MBB3036325.1 deazaflavin-dependent oxidoreductase (nitroreductase family) [Hoyosella altamirensis]
MSIAGTIFVNTLKAHQALYERSGGRIGHKLLGVPTLLLTTKGRKTGKERVSALTYASVTGGYAVVASNGGASKNPGWLHNLIAQPEVKVQVGRDVFPAVARVVRPGDNEYDDAWAAVNRVNKNRYSAYQKMTSRPIPVVILAKN